LFAFGVDFGWRGAHDPGAESGNGPARDGQSSMARVLYIEDTENNRILIQRRLAQSGFEVLTAEDAERGLALAEQAQPDLILMDMSLPGLDGWTAARRLKEGGKTAHIPVIALTAHVMPGDRERALAAGCDDYDTKPFQFPRLIGKIQALLGASPKPPPE